MKIGRGGIATIVIVAIVVTVVVIVVAAASAVILLTPTGTTTTTTTASPTTTTTTTTITTYSSTEYGFSIKYPQNWVEGTGTGAAVYCNAPAIINNNPAASFNVQIPASAGGMTLDQLANAGKLLLENMFSGISFTNEKDVQVNGIEGHEWTVVVVDTGTGINATMRQDFFIVNNKVYTITFAAISESYGDYASIFDTILNSFTVL